MDYKICIWTLGKVAKVLCLKKCAAVNFTALIVKVKLCQIANTQVVAETLGDKYFSVVIKSSILHLICKDMTLYKYMWNVYCKISISYTYMYKLF